MKYRHAFHAGNFADVHKHVTLLALLQALQRKDTGFLYLETHAGAGRYDLAAAGTRHGAEARHGLLTVMGAPALQAPELVHYRDLVESLRTREGANLYPGSPWLAARSLRAQDRGLCCELLPPECRALERTLGGYRRVRVESTDGWKQLRASLPPLERRALVLIDPPYEQPAAEWQLAAGALHDALQRLANAVLLLWYPIKDDRTHAPALRPLARSLAAPSLCLELWVHPRDSRVGLNGSGLLIVNPPYQFEERARIWQPELHALLDPGRRGGCSLEACAGSDQTHA